MHPTLLSGFASEHVRDLTAHAETSGLARYARQVRHAQHDAHLARPTENGRTAAVPSARQPHESEKADVTARAA